MTDLGVTELAYANVCVGELVLALGALPDDAVAGATNISVVFPHAVEPGNPADGLARPTLAYGFSVPSLDVPPAQFRGR